MLIHLDVLAVEEGKVLAEESRYSQNYINDLIQEDKINVFHHAIVTFNIMGQGTKCMIALFIK